MAGTAAPRLYPLADLLRVARIPSRTALGRMLGCRVSHLGDRLTDRQADRLAVALGLHPGTVWVEWWVDADDDGTAAA
jgi:hypothetical protein